jgi:acetoin utilization deacetylase AcuC-like enzyme
MTTALVWHEKLMWFDTGTFAGPMPAGGWVQPGDPAENPEAKRRIKNLLDATGMTARMIAITPTPATDEDILRVHTGVYLAKVKALSGAYVASSASAPSPAPAAMNMRYCRRVRR